MAVGALVGSAVLGAASKVKGAKDKKKDFQNLAVEAQPFNVFGPGGASSTFGDGSRPAGGSKFGGGGAGGGTKGGGGGNATPEDFGGGKSGMIQAMQANGQLGGAGGGSKGPDGGANQSLNIGLGNNEGNFDALGKLGSGSLLGAAQGTDASQFAIGDKSSNQFRKLLNQKGAGFLNAIEGGQDATDSALSRLREQSKPFEDRAQQALTQNQFGTGQLGTTGGGIQTEAFARGLGQADLSRQLSANQEGRDHVNQALQGLTGVTGLNLGTQSNDRAAQGFEQQFTSGKLGQAGQAFGMQNLLQGMGIDLAQLGLNASGLQANAAVGSGSNQANFGSASPGGSKLGGAGNILGSMGSVIGGK